MACIGVLALQGGYAPHLQALSELAHRAVEVRTAAELEPLDGLVLPGGESTTQLKLLFRHGLTEALDRFVRSGKPVLATCAGLILAAQKVRSPAQPSFGWIDVTVARNAWGRQIESFEALADKDSAGDGAAALPLVFIRAPRILSLSEKVKVLATFKDEPILVCQNNLTGATFHPELTADRRVHRAVFG